MQTFLLSPPHFKPKTCFPAPSGGKIPGKAFFDFAVPSSSEYAYFKSKQMLLVRLPFKWERLQPNITGPLAPEYLQLLHEQVGFAANYSMKIILDCHAFGGAYGHKLGYDCTMHCREAVLPFTSPLFSFCFPYISRYVKC